MVVTEEYLEAGNKLEEKYGGPHPVNRVSCQKGVGDIALRGPEHFSPYGIVHDEENDRLQIPGLHHLHSTSELRPDIPTF